MNKKAAEQLTDRLQERVEKTLSAKAPSSALAASADVVLILETLAISRGLKWRKILDQHKERYIIGSVEDNLRKNMKGLLSAENDEYWSSNAARIYIGLVYSLARLSIHAKTLNLEVEASRN